MGKSEGAADGSGDESGARGRSCSSSSVPGEGTSYTSPCIPQLPPSLSLWLRAREPGRHPKKYVFLRIAC